MIKYYKKISSITFVDNRYVGLIFSTIFVLIIFYLFKRLVFFFVKKVSNDRKKYMFNNFFTVILNVFKLIILLFIWDDYIKSVITLISFISAAMTIALRDFVLNFFCGIYIKLKKIFKVEDRIQIEDIKGDVVNVSLFNFEILEVSTAEVNGQSTGIIVNFPNSIIMMKPVKNINKGFKYIWSEIKIKIDINSDLSLNKKEIYRIVNSLDVINKIPKKMKKQIDSVNATNRIYFNKYDPIIYTKIVDNYVELTVRYLIHPKKARYVESVIWNNIYLSYKEGKIDLFLK